LGPAAQTAGLANGEVQVVQVSGIAYRPIVGEHCSKSEAELGVWQRAFIAAETTRAVRCERKERVLREVSGFRLGDEPPGGASLQPSQQIRLTR